jgi:predicted nucleic acid-binding protein
MAGAPVFLDTSALFEAADRAGRHHASARDALRDLLASRVELITTEHVVAELHGLALGRVGPKAALELVERVAASSRVEVLATGPDRLREGIRLLRQRPGRRLSLVDAISFLAMRASGSTTAFSLDADFAAEGFELLPDPTATP